VVGPLGRHAEQRRWLQARVEQAEQVVLDDGHVGASGDLDDRLAAAEVEAGRGRALQRGHDIEQPCLAGARRALQRFRNQPAVIHLDRHQRHAEVAGDALDGRVVQALDEHPVARLGDG